MQHSRSNFRTRFLYAGLFPDDVVKVGHGFGLGLFRFEVKRYIVTSSGACMRGYLSNLSSDKFLAETYALKNKSRWWSLIRRDFPCLMKHAPNLHKCLYSRGWVLGGTDCCVVRDNGACDWLGLVAIFDNCLHAWPPAVFHPYCTAVAFRGQFACK